MSKGWLQPWKYITVEIAENTVFGPAIYSPGGPYQPYENGFLQELFNNIYYPVYYADGTGYVVQDNAEHTERPVGILYEVFQNENMGAKVMVSGIAPLKIAGGKTVKPGQWVKWTHVKSDSSQSGIEPYDYTTDKDNGMPLGIAIQGGKGFTQGNDSHTGDVVPVILKTLPDSAIPVAPVN